MTYSQLKEAIKTIKKSAGESYHVRIFCAGLANCFEGSIHEPNVDTGFVQVDMRSVDSSDIFPVLINTSSIVAIAKIGLSAATAAR
jgi:hypothetical protein